MTEEQLIATAKTAQRTSDFPALERTARELIACGDDRGDATAAGNGYAYLGAALIGRNDAPGARAAFERSRESLQTAGDAMGVVRALNGLGVAAMDLELDVAAARRYLDDALALALATAGPDCHWGSDRHWLGIVIGNLGEAKRFQGDYRGAIASGHEALTIMKQCADAARAAWQMVNIAHCQLLAGNAPAAVKSLRKAFDYLSQDARDPKICALYLDVWFLVAASLDEWSTAARLLGFVDAFRERHALVRLPLLLPWIGPNVRRLERKLPPRELASLLAEGAALSVAGADELTLRLAAIAAAETLPARRVLQAVSR
ncbi:MAG: tetratricopeptide repeat protein [Candidatus Eremiobacteraeota bacterium]|nr:tetratricopeptide repeat protein [Candidatus Eremiobacteraeota bacterium]